MRLTFPVTFVVSALLTSCSRSNTSLPGAQPAPVERITLQVSNDNFLDVVVYVVHYGNWRRVGTARGGCTESFRISQELVDVSDARIGLDAIGSARRIVLDPVPISAHGVLELVIRSPLELSFMRERLEHGQETT